MVKYIIVGIGGFMGSVLRYTVSGLVHRLIQKPLIPAGTLTVNILGCLIIGFLGGLSETKQIFNPEKG